jgi:hypothetical protein
VREACSEVHSLASWHSVSAYTYEERAREKMVKRVSSFDLTDGLVWLLLYAHRHRSISGAAGHIMLTPANQLTTEIGVERRRDRHLMECAPVGNKSVVSVPWTFSVCASIWFPNQTYAHTDTPRQTVDMDVQTGGTLKQT